MYNDFWVVYNLELWAIYIIIFTKQMHERKRLLLYTLKKSLTMTNINRSMSVNAISHLLYVATAWYYLAKNAPLLPSS